MTTSSGAFLDSTDVLDEVLTPQKAPEEVVTDGYEGAILLCSVVRDDPIHYIDKCLLQYYEYTSVYTT